MKRTYEEPTLWVEIVNLEENFLQSSYYLGGGGSYTDDDLIDNGSY